MPLIRQSWVLRIASDPVCYLWSGHGLLETPADDIDAGGATWLGAGALVDIPSLRVLLNGIAERVEFTLSGVSAETLRLAQDDMDTVHLAEVRLGRVEFDTDWQLDGGIAWEWRGIADALRVTSRYNGRDRNRAIILMIGGADTFRANPQFTNWSDASQRLRSADDAFCDQVAKISVNSTRRFGPT